MNLKRFVSIIVSVGILFYLYGQIDRENLWRVWQNCDRQTLAVSLAMVIPITLVTSWRLQQLVPQPGIGLIEANRLILGASVLNMVLPSKMGDIAKAYFMSDRSNISTSLALAISIFEKACDLLSLLLWCAFGLLLYSAKDHLFWMMTTAVMAGLVLGWLMLGSRQFADFWFRLIIGLVPQPLQHKMRKMQSSWSQMYCYFWGNQRQLFMVAIISVFIWYLHLLQIWLFILALKASVPFVTSLALSPLSILAGLLPLTFAGVGTRDAALIYFYQDYLSQATGAALGILCTSRYFIPALIGLPFLRQMLEAVNSKTKN